MVRLVDAAAQNSSGLICAADRELGTDPGGWRVGRRGVVEIYRRSETSSEPYEFLELAAFDSGLLVVDAGWPIPRLLAGADSVVPRLTRASIVLVCRATVPGVRRAALAMTNLPRQPIIVAVGARRLPGEVRASFGPLLRTAYDAGRVNLLPFDRRLEVSGIDARPLPRRVAAAAAGLLDLLWPEIPTAERADRAYRAKG